MIKQTFSPLQTELSKTIWRLTANMTEPSASVLQRHADMLDEAVAGYAAGTVGVKKVIGVWARARRAYCEETGRPLWG